MINKKTYKCSECGLHYTDPQKMKECKKWCSEHKNCNPKITKFSNELQK